ncbi:MAG: hypothetical protein AAF581_21470 [Planctomycetota bacterium]
MSISGIVIRLHRDSELARAGRAALQTEPRIELGTATSDRIPAVLDTVDRDESKRLVSWIEELEGVANVDVVFVSTESDSAELLQKRESIHAD